MRSIYITALLLLLGCGGPIQRADERAALGDLLGALKILDQALAEDPDDPPARRHRDALRQALTRREIDAARGALPDLQGACAHAQRAAQHHAPEADLDALQREIGEHAYTLALAALEAPASAYARVDALRACPSPREHIERTRAALSAHLSGLARQHAAARRYEAGYALIKHIIDNDPARRVEGEALSAALRAEARGWRA
ncbi:hypothetical protein KJ940_19490, partial [Myxococcota bacterium]|nr:hypothetical protein [Myxococcota bacterium]